MKFIAKQLKPQRFIRVCFGSSESVVTVFAVICNVRTKSALT